MRFLLACTLLAAAPTARGDTLRCDARIVSTGALAAEVLAACGTPAHRDRWHAAPHYVVDEEQWYYNFGAQRLVQVLRFRHGQLVSIQSDGYGFDTPPASRCAPHDIVRGLSTFRLLHRCGEPLTREAFDALRPLREGDPARRDGAWRPVHRERWVYDFGPDTRTRIVELRDGRVVEVESGDVGGAPRDR
jgi:hypothetical protein